MKPDYVVDYPPTHHSYDYIFTSQQLTILGDSAPSPVPESKRRCFNCDSSDHLSSDCPFPRDIAAINRNRTAFQEETGTMGAGGRLGGEDSERSRMLEFVERFEPGRVSAELRYALGYGISEMQKEMIEYPWFRRMAEFGYPSGWTLREGDQNPMEVVKDRIGRDIDYDAVETLQILDGRLAFSSSDSPLLHLTTELNHDPNSIILPPAPPLPLDDPPPPPPPFDPPPSRPPARNKLIYSPTYSFASDQLPIYRSQCSRRLEETLYSPSAAELALMRENSDIGAEQTD